MSGIGKIAFEHLKYNHANNHDNIVTIFFRYSENQKNSRQKSLLRTKVITFLFQYSNTSLWETRFYTFLKMEYSVSKLLLLLLHMEFPIQDQQI